MKKDRLTAFTDAVLAIIMTILVLELKKPDELSLAGFWALRENFFAYTVSFFWLGAIWANLHNEWDNVEVISRKTVWLTLVTLFFASFFPYSTSIVATDFSSGIAQSFYGLIVLLVTFSNMATYKNLLTLNPDNPNFLKSINERKKVLNVDIGIKIAGFILAVTVYPPAMLISVLISLGFLLFLTIK